MAIIRFFAGCQVAYMNSMLNLSMVPKIKKKNMIEMCGFYSWPDL